MNITEIWEDFSINIVNVVHAQKTSKDIFNSQFNKIYKFEESFSVDSDPKTPVSSQNMFFICMKTNKTIYYGHRILGIKEVKEHCLAQKNRHYQFLFMEAYEAFENAIINIYAYIGKNTPDGWPLNEYGNVKYTEIANKDFSFFCEQAKKRRGSHIDICKLLLSNFKCNLIHKQKYELIFFIILSEKIRHKIVHCNGIIDNRDNFIERVAKDCGQYNNGKIDANIKDYIEYFLYDLNGKIIINLTEEIFSPAPISFEQNRFTLLVDKLLNCIHLLYTEIAQGTP